MEERKPSQTELEKSEAKLLAVDDVEMQSGNESVVASSPSPAMLPPAGRSSTSKTSIPSKFVRKGQQSQQMIPASPYEAARDYADGNNTSDEASMQIIEETRIMSQSQVPEVTVMDSVREQLQSLMDTLKQAALARGDVSEVEDLLMDTKELLYGAARRGRKS